MLPDMTVHSLSTTVFCSPSTNKFSMSGSILNDSDKELMGPVYPFPYGLLLIVVGSQLCCPNCYDVIANNYSEINNLKR